MPSHRLSLAALGIASVWLAAACSGPPDPHDHDATGAASSAVTAPPDTVPAGRMGLVVPALTDFRNVAIGASSYLRLHESIQVVDDAGIPAPVANAGAVLTDVGAHDRLGEITSVARVDVHDGAEIHGAILSSGAVTKGAGVAADGQTIANVALSTSVTSWPVELPARGPDVYAAGPTQVETLAPGSYGMVAANLGTIALRTGTYYFDSLDLEEPSTVTLDASAGPIVVYLKTSLVWRGAHEVTGPADSILFGLLGGAPVTIQSEFDGTILAPNAPVRLGLTGKRYAGSLFAQTVEIDPGVAFTFRPFSSWSTFAPRPVVMTDAPVIVRSEKTHATGAVVDERSGTGIVKVEIPELIPVSTGNAGRGGATLSFDDPAGGRVKCLYAGTSTVDHPVTEIDRARGMRYSFVSCSNGMAAGASAWGSGFTLHIDGDDPQDFAPTTGIELHLGGGCSGALPPPMSPEEVVTLKQSFSWRATPALPETDPDGNPALRYGVVYVENEDQLANLDRLNVFWDAQPLDEEDGDLYAGKCGSAEHATDGKGVMVFAIFPARLFNIYREAGIYSELNGIDAPFRLMAPAELDRQDALNADGSLSYAALAQAGYHEWLSAKRAQQPWFGSKAFKWVKKHVIKPVATAVSTYGADLVGYANKAWTGFVNWTANAIDNVWESAQIGLGKFVGLFKGHVNVTLDVTVLNRDAAFVKGSPMIRAWGSSAGTKLLPHGTTVVVKQWGWKFLPTRGETRMGASGHVVVQAVKGSKARSGGVCIEMDSSDGMMTSDLVPNEICNFDGLSFDGFHHDVTNALSTDQRQVHTMTQVVDGADYARTVVGHGPHKAKILTGPIASGITGVINHGMPQTPCLDYPSAGAAGISFLTTGLGVELGGAVGGIIGAASSVLVEKDIWWGKEPRANDSRAVMTHEYGHFLMCSILFSEDGPAGLNGLLTRLGEGQADSRDDERALMLEGMADNFALQVAGGTNYFDGQGAFHQSGSAIGFNVAANGLEFNFKGMNETGEKNPFDDEDARWASLMHDAFDTTDGHQRMTNAPWNGDVWTVDPHTALIGLSPTGYIALADENVTIGGGGWVSWYRHWLKHGRQPTKENVLAGLADAMKDSGADWCNVCEAFALHSPLMTSRGVPEVAATFADRFARWKICVDDGLTGYVGAPPEANLTLDASCRACPALMHPDATSGACAPCAANEIATGISCTACPNGTVPGSDNQCHACPAHQISKGGVCVACRIGEGADLSTNTCIECPADTVVEWGGVKTSCESQGPVITTLPPASDVCADELWVEVRGIDQVLPFPDAAGFMASLTPANAPATQAACTNTVVNLRGFRPGNGPTEALWERFDTEAKVGTWPDPCPPNAPLCLAPSCDLRTGVEVPLRLIESGVSKVRFIPVTEDISKLPQITMLPSAMSFSDVDDSCVQ